MKIGKLHNRELRAIRKLSRRYDNQGGDNLFAEASIRDISIGHVSKAICQPR